MDAELFKIAGLVLLVKARKDYLEDALRDFAYTGTDKPDVFVTVVTEQQQDYSQGKMLIEDNLLSISETESAYFVRYHGFSFVEGYINRKYTGESVVYLHGQSCKGVPDEIKRQEVMCTIRDTFFFHMQKKGRIAVHSASVVYRDRVWLFAAMSGTGKTTHIALWHENGYPARDFNGDLAICYIDNSDAVAAGSPWCGTSGVYCNEERKLGGIVFLEQAEENSVRNMTVGESVMRLAARCLTPNWNRELMTLNLNVAEQMAPIILSGVLNCNMNPAAAAKAKEFIDEACSTDA